MMAHQDQNSDVITKEGYLELQTGSGYRRSFHRRYCIVKKSGIVNLFEKKDKLSNAKESFHIQGGEEIVLPNIYKKRFRLKIIIPQSKKAKKWCFGFESESSQKAWHNAFDSILKQMDSLSRLHIVLSASNANTIDGQLMIGAAFAECGQLERARKIFTKLVEENGDERDECHEKYESFLSVHCNDIHSAETHFLRRKKFFCLPKEFIQTELGQNFLSKLPKRIEFLKSMKVKLNNNKNKYEFEYRNIENIWPYYLYSVSAKNLKYSRKIVRRFLKQTNRNTLQFEYSYGEIEEFAWNIIRTCVYEKKGAVKLQSRLELVAVAERKNIVTSKAMRKLDSVPFPSKHQYEKQQEQKEQKQRKMTESQSASMDMSDLDELAGTLAGTYFDGDEEDDLFDGDTENFAKLNQVNENEQLQHSESEEEEDNFAALETEMAAASYNSYNKTPKLKSICVSSEVNDILDVNMDDLKLQNDGDHNLNIYAFDDVFSAIDGILQQKESLQHINPWTAFLLIWIMRRDEMQHIKTSTDIEQVQVILEFIYLFLRGCLQKFDHFRSEYSLLLCALYNLATNEEKYKMCLEATRVIGGSQIDFKNKHSVSQFIQSHNWLSDVLGKSKNETIQQYIVKGFRSEIQRIHDLLNEYYEKVLFCHKLYTKLMTFKTKNKVNTEMISQTAEKVQGTTTWGPRQETKYDPSAFNLVCVSREIEPIPKPKLNPGDFDECYMLFCLALAKRLNPHFQKQVQKATNSINNCRHYAMAIKSEKQCYEVMTKELKNKSSPKAARILDYCKCTLSFEDVNDLMDGFKALDDNFRICRIANYFGQNARKSINNYKYMNVYIVCKHPTCKYNKMICEVRLSLHYVKKLHDEREQVKECFNSMLQPSEILDVMKKVAMGTK